MLNLLLFFIANTALEREGATHPMEESCCASSIVEQRLIVSFMKGWLTRGQSTGRNRCYGSGGTGGVVGRANREGPGPWRGGSARALASKTRLVDAKTLTTNNTSS